MASLIEKGTEFYNQNLKTLLEPDRNGEFIAIEPETGRYFLGSTSREAMDAAHQALPDGKFYLQKIGFTFAHSLVGFKTSAK